MCGRVSPSIPFTLTTPLSVVTHVPVVHSVCAGDMSGSSSEEEEEEEETEVAEGGLEMLVAGKRLEEVRPHLFMPHHQFVPICPLLRPYLILFSPSSPPPLPLLSLSLLFPSSFPHLSLIFSPLPPLSIFFPSSPSSLPPLFLLSFLFSLKGMSDRRGSIQCCSSCRTVPTQGNHPGYN